MRNFKKVLASLVSVVLLAAVASCLIMEPYLHSERFFYQDARVREELAGQLDVITLGASNGMCAFDPSVMDRVLGCESYNVSVSMMPMAGREFFLRLETGRNPIHTVIMDVSSETLVREEAAEHAEGDNFVFAQLSGMGQRLEYLTRYVPFDTWQDLYANVFSSSLRYWLTVLRGDTASDLDAAAKGFYGRDGRDISLNAEEARELHNTQYLDTPFREDSLASLIRQIEYCRERGIRVVLAVCPKSDVELWERDNLDLFRQELEEVAREYDCLLIDANLLKDRSSLWNDRESFYDGDHMSAQGAQVFTEWFCSLLLEAEQGDISGYFYDTYQQAREASPYMAYLP